MLDLGAIKNRRPFYPGQTGEQRAEFIAWAPLDIDTLLAEVERLQTREIVAAFTALFNELPATLNDKEINTVLRRAGHDPENVSAEFREMAEEIIDREISRVSRELEPEVLKCELCEMEILVKNMVRVGSHHHALCAGCAATYSIQETKDDESPF